MEQKIHNNHMCNGREWLKVVYGPFIIWKGVRDTD